MKRRSFLGVVLMSGLAGCAVPALQGAVVRPEIARSYDLRALRFQARADLVISESETFYPAADVVWRGDPTGPRIAQIEAMFQEAAARNQKVLNGNTPVDAEITLVRFHGVTRRTRYTVGGVYNVVFDLTVRDAATGAVLEPPRRVVANLDAPGGEEAVVLEESGQTEKVRVTDFLTEVLTAQLL